MFTETAGFQGGTAAARIFGANVPTIYSSRGLWMSRTYSNVGFPAVETPLPGQLSAGAGGLSSVTITQALPMIGVRGDYGSALFVIIGIAGPPVAYTISNALGIERFTYQRLKALVLLYSCSKLSL
jgi:hypothetical protein